jgi:hypothetical protein
MHILLFSSLPLFLTRADQMTGSQKFLATLSSPAAFGLGCGYIAANEVNQNQLTWSNMREGTNPVRVCLCVCVCVCVCVVFSLLLPLSQAAQAHSPV